MAVRRAPDMDTRPSGESSLSARCTSSSLPPAMIARRRSTMARRPARHRRIDPADTPLGQPLGALDRVRRVWRYPCRRAADPLVDAARGSRAPPRPPPSREASGRASRRPAACSRSGTTVRPETSSGASCERFQPRTSCPDETSSRARGRPMRPSPSTQIDSAVDLDMSSRSRPCSTASTAARHDERGGDQLVRAAAPARRCCSCTATRRPTSCGTRSRRGSPRASPWSAADLRGYGDSSKPPGGDDHAATRSGRWPCDQVEVMARARLRPLRASSATIAARGSPTGSPSTTRSAWRGSPCSTSCRPGRLPGDDQEIATSTFHWFFLIQPDGLPSGCSATSPEYFLRRMLGRWSAGADFDPDAVAEYERCFRDPETIRATCEDYRAGASIDLVHDEADRGRRRSTSRCSSSGAPTGTSSRCSTSRRLGRALPRRARAARSPRALPRRGASRRDARRAARLPRRVAVDRPASRPAH